MEIRYFAWVRERIGKGGEPYEGFARSIDDLIDELVARGSGYASAFEDRSILRFAADHEIVDTASSLEGVDELAIFPPMTGG